MNMYALITLLLFPSSLVAELHVETFRGTEISAHIKEIRGLCDSIYCESPYLHNGQDHGYDSYLETYAKAKQSVACLAYDDKKIVGMAAGMAMSETKEVFRKPLEDHAHDLEGVFYLGEFGLRPEYQGKGVEEKMYSKIEACAKESGLYKMICFCEID